MSSLARRHFQRATSAEASASADVGAPINANAYELMLVKLAEDRRRLKQVQSIERKIEIKRDMLPAYQPWVDGALSAGRGGQDDVLMTVMVWNLDTGNYAAALQITAYALQHGLTLPDQYKRDVATLVAEELSERALTLIGAGAEPGEISAALNYTEELTGDRDMPDEVRAKLHKAIGLCYAHRAAASETPDRMHANGNAGLDHLRRAFSLHEKVGVKRDVEKLERLLKNNPYNPASDGNIADPADAGKSADSGAAATGDAGAADAGSSG